MVNGPIYSPHLDSSKVHSYTTKIPTNKIKSMQHLPITVSSFSYGPSTNHFVDGNVVTVTSGNIFRTSAHDFNKYGFFSQVDDGVSRGSVKFSGMDDWIANGTQNYPNLENNKPIPTLYDITGNKVGGVMYIEGVTPLKLWMPERNDTTVNLYTTPRLVEATDINSIGKRTSQVENFRQKIHSDVLFNENNQLHYEIAKWAEFLDSEGVHPRKNPVLGIGVGKGDYLAGHYPQADYLIANTDFHELAKAWISQYGLSDREAVSAMERAAIMHELAHAYGINGKRDGEERQGRLWKKFYSKLSKDFAGTKYERIYKALERLGQDYERRFSLVETIKRELTEGPQKHEAVPWHIINHKFEHEADALEEILTLQGKSKEEYIQERIMDTYGRALGAEESRTANHSNIASLERIVESASGEAHGKSDSNYTSAKGKVLKFTVKSRKERVSDKSSKTYARSSARETYERGNQSDYNEDSRNVEADGKENSDARTSEKGDSESGAESQASEKAA